ncbi:hypothetical protein Alg130_10967 [Pyrenophora tritici-repentis]|nr:hypothetical protein Alg130_10967 [Pyrenophora tritici-repentis]
MAFAELSTLLSTSRLATELRLQVARSTCPNTTLEEWARMRDEGQWEAAGLSAELAFTEWVKAQAAGSAFGSSLLRAIEVDFLMDHVPVLVKHHVSLSVMFREGVPTMSLVKESGRMPACEGGEGCKQCAGGKGFKPAELRRSYLVLQADHDASSNFRKAVIGELTVENLAFVINGSVRFMHRMGDAKFDAVCIQLLTDVLWYGKEGCTCILDAFACDGCLELRSSRPRFVPVWRYTGVFSRSDAPWFAGVTEAVDAVCELDVNVKPWLHCGGT